MPITILTGMPGAGKSKRLITTVNHARELGRVTITFCCSDSPVLRSRKGFAKHHLLSSRDPAVITRLDHFVSAKECILLLRDAPAGTLAAFDEAQHFGDTVIQPWLLAAHRGVDLLIASPSNAQLEGLRTRGHRVTQLTMRCQRCREVDAATFLCYLDQDRTESVCNSCLKLLQEEARDEILTRLRAQAPHRGQERIYQPVELAEYQGWQVLRSDSSRRYQVMRRACAEYGLPGAHSTYLDLGCNTGFFCYWMTKAGFTSTGVDIVEGDLGVARLLSTFFRRDYVHYVLSDVQEYLRSTVADKFDVASAFSIFQWVMIQTTPQKGIDCMHWLFQKTRRVCFLEMGEYTEAHYVERAGIEYDRDWVYKFMKDHGEFSRIEIANKREFGLKRDLFIGFK